MMDAVVGRPNIGDRTILIDRINAILDSGRLTNNGPIVQEFERRIAEYVGVSHAIVVTNATIGLEIAARALGLHGEVVVPSYTFVATAHALSWQGITPVFADIDPETHNLDPAAVEAQITERTTGIIAVHLWGRPADVDGLADVAARHGVELMFDSAHAFGCSRGGTMIGGFGRCEVFSFHATKFLNSFEGGAIVTNDAELAKKARLMRNFGFAGTDKVVCEGTNGKMPEICAAMGLTSLEAIGEIIDANRRNYETYAKMLGEAESVELLQYDPEELNNYQYIVAIVESEERRDWIVEALRTRGTMARKYFWPGVHNMGPYNSHPQRTMLPNTADVAAKVAVLPTGPSVSVDTIAKVCEVVRG